MALPAGKQPVGSASVFREKIPFLVGFCGSYL